MTSDLIIIAIFWLILLFYHIRLDYARNAMIFSIKRYAKKDKNKKTRQMTNIVSLEKSSQFCVSLNLTIF